MAQIRHVSASAGSSRNTRSGTVCGSSPQWRCISRMWALIFGCRSTITSAATTGGSGLRCFLWCSARSPCRSSVSAGLSMISAPRRAPAAAAARRAAPTWTGSFSAAPLRTETLEPTRLRLKDRRPRRARATPQATAATALPQPGLVRHAQRPVPSVSGCCSPSFTSYSSDKSGGELERFIFNGTCDLKSRGRVFTACPL